MENSGYNCTNYIGPEEDSAYVNTGIYGTGICWSPYLIFNESLSFGWECDESKGYYVTRVWNDSNCTIPNTVYKEEFYDDSCLLYEYQTWDSENWVSVWKEIMFWSNVECNAFTGTNDTSNTVTASPTKATKSITSTKSTTSIDGDNGNNGNMILVMNVMLAALLVAIMLL